MEHAASSDQVLLAFAEARNEQDHEVHNVAVEEGKIISSALRDRAAFAELYRRYVTPLYRYLYQQIGNPHDAEDLVGSTFRKAMESLNRYEGKGSFAAWLFSIARHTLLDHVRANSGSRRALDMASVGPFLVDPAPQPDAQYLQAEQTALLQRLVGTLPDDQREALSLRIFGELRIKEVAVVMDRSEGAVAMLIHRAVLTLRTQYDQYAQEQEIEP